jgi:hypothetical protein
MAEKFCTKHGPYDASLINCPFCERERGLPGAPTPLDDELATDPWGGRSGQPNRTASRPAGDDDETDFGIRARYLESEDEMTQLPESRRGVDYDPDETVVEHQEEGLLGFLVVKEGARRGQVHRISGGTTVGRSNAKLVLRDAKVSRPHAKFTVEGEAFTIWDFGSENGTFVNGERITGATPLKENDEIKIGDTVFVLKTLG